jgi:hypothetical protein
LASRPAHPAIVPHYNIYTPSAPSSQRIEGRGREIRCWWRNRERNVVLKMFMKKQKRNFRNGLESEKYILSGNIHTGFLIYI